MFAHVRNVELCEPETPDAGCYASFEFIDDKPATNGYLPVARNIAIYATKSAGIRALEGGAL